jgi:hypothetical protein
VKEKKLWISGRSDRLEMEANGDVLAANRDEWWAFGRPAETLDDISAAKRPQVKTEIGLAELERVIATDDALGSNQREQMLKEIRWFENYARARSEIAL